MSENQHLNQEYQPVVDETCLFCKIIAGEIPSTKVYEDDMILAFLDINPQAPVHILVIPKTHIASLAELNAANVGAVESVMRAIPVIAKAQSLEAGYRVVTNIGEHGAQSVKHLHFHILGGKQLSGKMG